VSAWEEIEQRAREAEAKQRERAQQRKREAAQLRAWMETNDRATLEFLDLFVPAFDAKVKRYWCFLKNSEGEK
jgi:hypothetical protein